MVPSVRLLRIHCVKLAAPRTGEEGVIVLELPLKLTESVSKIKADEGRCAEEEKNK